MSLIAKLLIALVVAVAASALTTLMMTGEWFDFRILIGFFFATTGTALLVSGGAPAHPTARSSIATNTTNDNSSSTSSGDRVEGEVKWFNMSKGFGFIKQDNGEEIFVHFRSIRGEGRRGLRDGQRVSFTVADSDKGPQADDVVAED